MEINTFDQWLDTLEEALTNAKTMGMPENILKQSATQLGNFLAENINPDIPENRFLKSLWRLADDTEKQVLASLMIKYVENRPVH